MKKTLSILMVLLLCVAAVSFAENAPSKTTADLVKFSAVAANQPNDPSAIFLPVTEAALGDKIANFKELKALADSELAKLQASESPIAYFGEAKDGKGAAVSLADFFGTTDVKVNEFFAVIAENFKDDCGDVTLTMLLSTPYEVDTKIHVMIGLVDADGKIAWQAFPGKVLPMIEGQPESAGRIQCVLPQETVLAVQNGKALMAVVNN